MNIKSILLISMVFPKMAFPEINKTSTLENYKLPNFSFNIPFTTKKQKTIFEYQNISYSKEYPKRIFFPAYAKTSKMINGNRYGKHSILEYKLKRREKKWI